MSVSAETAQDAADTGAGSEDDIAHAATVHSLLLDRAAFADVERDALALDLAVG
ncbi:hypothetical protein ITJ66_02445 [Plantibacter sp. VKM Ac-2885]|uniref:hypothetical protein n=1 Tax=Plantibacter sp. VKM Ac-2885 TaxID=2783828 RepID=UPI00188BC895|nr:hypothetical protein [Plantibacter sp. VKM Ac-2885]MBF4511333.1 hypothetical protein [Plantibacter sp. VKM Ac-2885]